MHEGHRQRMYEKLISSADRLENHELLEILLYAAIPRKNTNEIAHRLLSACGGLEGVFDADEETLLGVKGIGVSAARRIRLTAECMRRLREQQPFPIPDIGNRAALIDYFIARFEQTGYEVVEFYTANAENQARFLHRFVIDRDSALQKILSSLNTMLASKKPYNLFVVHHSAKKTASASAEDDRLLNRILILCELNHVKLYEYIVVGKVSAFSYFTTGRLQYLKSMNDLRTPYLSLKT